MISSPYRSGRPITEILREAQQRNSTVTLDEDFGKDLEEIIFSHQQPGIRPPGISAGFQHGDRRRAKQAAAGQRRREYIEEQVSLVPVHPATNRTGWLVGQIEGQEAAKGNVLPCNDLMIAAAAIEQSYVVLTGNLRHFRKIPGLTVIPF